MLSIQGKEYNLLFFLIRKNIAVAGERMISEVWEFALISSMRG